MRLRFHPVIYHSGSAALSLEHHYRELRDAMFHLGQQYTYLQPGTVWRPAMDIHETPTAVLIKIELAGIEEEGIEITVYPNAIVVAGQRIDDSDCDEATYYHEAQIRYGPFRADAYLSTPIQPEMTSAAYQNGFLRITLPRQPQENTPPGEPERQHDAGKNDEDTSESGLSSWSSASQYTVSEAATDRLTYSAPKEISHV